MKPIPLRVAAPPNGDLWTTCGDVRSRSGMGSEAILGAYFSFGSSDPIRLRCLSRRRIPWDDDGVDVVGLQGFGIGRYA